jgi:hypothetical protein
VVVAVGDVVNADTAQPASRSTPAVVSTHTRMCPDLCCWVVPFALPGLKAAALLWDGDSGVMAS